MTFDLATLATLAGFVTPATIVAGWAYRRIGAMRRTLVALEQAVDLHDAQNRGVVLVLTAPGHPRSAIPLLRQAGWTVCPYTVMEQEGALIPPMTAGEPRYKFLDDLAVADVVLVQGFPVAEAAALAQLRVFRDNLAPGAGVVLFTPSNIRYDQNLWGDGDQSVTTPATAEAAVRSAVARRRHIQALQGVRPGGLAAARASLPGV